MFFVGKMAFVEHDNHDDIEIYMTKGSSSVKLSSSLLSAVLIPVLLLSRWLTVTLAMLLKTESPHLHKQRSWFHREAPKWQRRVVPEAFVPIALNPIKFIVKREEKSSLNLFSMVEPSLKKFTIAENMLTFPELNGRW